MSSEEVKKENGDKHCVCGGDKREWCMSRRGSGDVGAIEPFFAFFAHVCEYSGRITTIDIDVTKHCRGTVCLFVIKSFREWASKVLEGRATCLGWIIWSFAFARYNCVILARKIFLACYYFIRSLIWILLINYNLSSDMLIINGVCMSSYYDQWFKFCLSNKKMIQILGDYISYVSLPEEELGLWLDVTQIHQLHVYTFH